MIYEVLPKVSVATMVIKNGNQVLLGKRRGGTYDGFYAFPGGQLELYEDFMYCAKRELVEECGQGFVVSEPHFFCFTNVIDQEKQKHFIAITMLAEWQSGDPIVAVPERCFGWEWFSFDNLPTTIFSHNRQAIEQFLKLDQTKLQV